ncbi:MAG: TonB family protein [Rhodanobacteraceae bacterium]
MTETVLASLTLLSAALALVMLLRKPVRHLLGPGPGFLLWLLVPAMTAAAWMKLPTLASLRPLTESAPIASLGALIVHPGNALPVATGHPAASSQSGYLLLALWLTGTCIMVLRLLLAHLQVTKRAQQPDATLHSLLAAQLDPATLARIRTHSMGPAVMFAWPCMILIPADFARRFNPQQRTLVLAHEQMHLHRADPLWRLIAELTRALLWFHPLVWLALPRFRLDQELACDTATLSGCQPSRAAYARTLMDDLGTSRVPALTGWVNPHQLKERLTMIKSRRIHSHRRRLGYSLVLAAIAASTLLVGAALSTSKAAHAETARDTPPVISVNVGDHGIYWNGDKVDSLSLQHRGVLTARIDPEIPVLLTIGSNVPDKQAGNIANALRQSGLSRVDLRHVDTTPLTNLPADGERQMQYRSQRRPHYPASAIRARQQGTVVLKVHISDDGDALGAKATNTGVATDLVKASLAAALSWKYTEGKDGWVRIPVQYTLHEFKGIPVNELPALPPGQEWRWSADGKSIRSVPTGPTSD